MLVGSQPLSSLADDDALIRKGRVLGIASIAALGGLLFGYDWVVIGGAKPFYELYFHLNTDTLIGWANSCALLGCLIGSSFSGMMSEYLGRKKVLLISGILFAISSVLTGWSYSLPAFVSWRITGGVAIGLASNISPTYIAEISPARWRGRLVSLNQLSLVLGILAAQITNWLIAQKVPEYATVLYIANSWNALYGWRWMFTAVALPAAVFFVCCFYIPESPRWLVFQGNDNHAYKVLSSIGGNDYAQAQLSRIKESLQIEVVKHASWGQLLRPKMRKVLLIAVGLAVLQQWCGINILFNYAEEVYKSAGYGISAVLFNIIITGTINLIFTLIAMTLIDRFGRRVLMLFGCLGVGTAHLLSGFAYYTHLQGLPVLLLTLIAIGIYAASLAPVTWVLITEIFPNRLRGLGVSAAVTSLWTSSFILTYSFPALLRSVGMAGTFFLYSGVCFLGTVLVYKSVPETKGESLENLEILLGTNESESIVSQ